MVDYQNSACAICKEKSPLYIDHCHSTDKVRGLLCRVCNVMLGHARDKTEILNAAADYLEGFKYAISELPEAAD
jgi:hypothetical protein